MKPTRYLSVADQVVDELRVGMASGRWRETLPGRDRLAREMGVNHKTVETAVRRLVADGWLVPQGATRRRKIVLPDERPESRELRVRILLHDRTDVGRGWNAGLLDQLHKAGFAANFAVKTLTELGMKLERVGRFVEKTGADAWVVCSGSREVLEWFAGQPVPAIAMFGRFTGLPIACASPRIAPAMRQAVRQLVALGHRRIVMLVAEERRKPFPALFEQLFLKELDAQGLPVGRYNLPDWPDSADGLRSCLDSLFAQTPPTAVIFGETRFFLAGQLHLARRGILAPDHVSLICSDPDPSFSWCNPTVSHFLWDPDPVIRRVVRWVKHLAAGKQDRRQVLFNGKFVDGGTIGPPPEGNRHGKGKPNLFPGEADR